MCHTYEIRYIYVRTSYAEHTHVIRMKYTCVIHMTYGVHKSIRDSYDRTFVIRMKCVIQMLTRHTQDIHTSYAGHTHVIRRTYTRHTQDIHTSYIWNIHVSYVWHTYDVPTCRGCIAVQCPLWHMYKCVPSYICTSVFPLTYVQVCSLLHMYDVWSMHDVCLLHSYEHLGIIVRAHILLYSGYVALQCPLLHMYKCVPSYICMTYVFSPTPRYYSTHLQDE